VRRSVQLIGAIAVVVLAGAPVLAVVAIRPLLTYTLAGGVLTGAAVGGVVGAFRARDAARRALLRLEPDPNGRKRARQTVKGVTISAGLVLALCLAYGIQRLTAESGSRHANPTSRRVGRLLVPEPYRASLRYSMLRQQWTLRERFEVNDTPRKMLGNPVHGPVMQRFHSDLRHAVIGAFRRRGWKVFGSTVKAVVFIHTRSFTPHVRSFPHFLTPNTIRLPRIRVSTPVRPAVLFPADKSTIILTTPSHTIYDPSSSSQQVDIAGDRERTTFTLETDLFVAEPVTFDIANSLGRTSLYAALRSVGFWKGVWLVFGVGFAGAVGVLMNFFVQRWLERKFPKPSSSVSVEAPA